MPLRRRVATAPPEGLVYVPDLLTADEERAVLAAVAKVPQEDVKMHGVVAKRRVAHFGILYGYTSREITPGPPLPTALEPLRARAADLAQVEAERLVEVLVSWYPPGSGIGWHRDAPMFGSKVIGISLLGACDLRFRRKRPEGYETWVQRLEPRSAYLLSGPARQSWQHRIVRAPEERISITFRTLRRSQI